MLTDTLLPLLDPRRHLGRLPRPIPWIAAGLIGRIPQARRLVSRIAINKYAYAVAPRPRPLTLAGDYTSWKSLTDRTYSGRHLPPSTAPPEELPAEQDVVALFRRSEEIPSTDTSLMFAFFAQWFTDSFLRTNRLDPRKNDSNHEIDLCQIYGVNEHKTNMLRAGHEGLLDSQFVNGEEFPKFLFAEREPGGELFFDPKFEGLHDREYLLNTILRACPDERKDSVFAVGLEHGNSTIGNTVLNVLFLREHNRIARRLVQQYPKWEDDRLFETTRNIMIVLLLKIVVEEYITHIGPFDFPIELVPFVAEEERWNRTNWCAIEFNLLYRWHSLIPDSTVFDSKRMSTRELVDNNPFVLDRGIDTVIAQFSRQKASKIGLRNTPAFLVDRHPGFPAYPSVEERTVHLMREARLRPYNAYRKEFGLGALASFADLTKDVALQKTMESLYGDIDNVEWYVGIFAEDYPEHRMMGNLMTTMVAHDAFTQALTNPLLARRVYNDRTFTKVGKEIIDQTHCLQQIVARNSQNPREAYASFRVE
ncbi:putative cyclooxygenase-2 [Rhodococcus sp. RD6.2]|uniref:peroxidase family protein n=1 Tax=Rhodococcus sp. RD6.2 TaxID=260936 RepID=UPI00063B384B|nr:peroxidase family protein [Rhodococcus sp. RD6.2]CRK49983.1 putative cyclooxygenase-2 [Rhodococcus sp. RD6.2]